MDLDTNNVRSDFEYKEKRQYDEHIPHKAQKCKCIQLTVQDESMKINSLHSVDLKKMYWELILFSLIFLKIIKM